MRLDARRIATAGLLLLTLFLSAAQSFAQNYDVSSTAGCPAVNTGLTIPAGTVVKYVAVGNIDNGSGNFGPEGNGVTAGGGFCAPGQFQFSLVGRFPGGNVQLGPQGTFTSPGGNLTLAVNDDFYGDNSGSFEVDLTEKTFYLFTGVATGALWNWAVAGPAGFGAPVAVGTVTPAVGLGPVAIVAAVAAAINAAGVLLVAATPVGNVLAVTGPVGTTLWVGPPPCNLNPGPCATPGPTLSTASRGGDVVNTGVTIIRVAGPPPPVETPGSGDVAMAFLASGLLVVSAATLLRRHRLA